MASHSEVSEAESVKMSNLHLSGSVQNDRQEKRAVPFIDFLRVGTA